MPDENTIRIGGASGYWGESDMALPQFLKEGNLDYIVFDYLAEITMSIMARARAKDPSRGYAGDFVSSVLKPNLSEIARQNVKILSNAGGVNPQACGEAVREIIKQAGLDLKVAVISGDDLLDQAETLAEAGHTEMFTGDVFPDPSKLASVNAYLGAFPVAAALNAGADIVITGRTVDSAVTLGACIYSFGWERGDLDKLASGSLAGHILECGPQATGGNFTDWESVADTLHNVGYPIAEISSDGVFTVTKPDDTGGIVNEGTIGEQMLYEIGDPQAYFLPDVVCDFSNVSLDQVGNDRVHVSGAKGRPAPDTYKVCATYADGFRAGTVSFFYGEQAGDKARAFGESVIKRARHKLRSVNAPDFTEVLIETVGDESEFGAFAETRESRSVALKVAVRHEEMSGAGLVLKEFSGHGLAGPPGLSGFAGGRSKPSPVLRLFSFALPKKNATIAIDVDGAPVPFAPEAGDAFSANELERVTPGDVSNGAMSEVPLIKLAWARSGDKGNKANVGVLPRNLDYAPYIWSALTEDVVKKRFAHYLNGDVKRYYLPGTGAINFLMDDVLGGGGVASLRNDPQGKGYSQILLQTPIAIPKELAMGLS